MIINRIIIMVEVTLESDRAVCTDGRVVKGMQLLIITSAAELNSVTLDPCDDLASSASGCYNQRMCITFRSAHCILWRYYSTCTTRQKDLGQPEDSDGSHSRDRLRQSHTNLFSLFLFKSTRRTRRRNVADLGHLFACSDDDSTQVGPIVETSLLFDKRVQNKRCQRADSLTPQSLRIIHCHLYSVHQISLVQLPSHHTGSICFAALPWGIWEWPGKAS